MGISLVIIRSVDLFTDYTRASKAYLKLTACRTTLQGCQLGSGGSGTKDGYRMFFDCRHQ
jgi:hypothetical protein